MNDLVNIPDIGLISTKEDFKLLKETSDGIFRSGVNGVASIACTGDRKVEFVAFEKKTIAHVKSSMGYHAYYPVYPVSLERPVKAVLMDLDGTSVRSEEFWIWIIQLSISSLMGNPEFELEEADLPFVSGHSVSEHLKYCIKKYCPDKTVEEAKNYYFEHTHREMKNILEGRGRKNAFTPTAGLKEFLLELKSMGIKIGLVTSGLYEKAWPEIVSAFETMKLGDPKDFYDTIISAGFPVGRGMAGTLGELSPKPHPWLYAEACRVGLGVEFSERNHVIGIEDSGAGVCSIRLAGYTAIGVSGGNIVESGVRGLCNYYLKDLTEVLNVVKG